ncbi:MAG: alpha/beta hydrolase [Candidatus Spechtbacteria bacterium]|nr:alpha/beta hydrolase [Candidatus Spechtbacteria bacterium]
MDKNITIQGIPVFYRDLGTGAVIVILHGWGSRANNWRAVQNDLAERGFRAIVPDMPGFGETPPPSEPWDIYQYTEFVYEFIQSLGLQDFTLVGHSFGGRIAIIYGAKHGENVSTLILCDAAGVVRRHTVRTRMFLITTKIGNVIFAVPPLHFLKPIVRNLWYKFTLERDYYKTDGVMRETFKKVINENLRKYVRHITLPTLILWGENDRATPLADAYIIQKEVADSRLHVFPERGHAINLEVPHEMAQTMAEFIAQHKNNNLKSQMANLKTESQI